MITDAIFYTALYTLSLIVSIFPSSSGFPVEVHQAALYFGGYLMILDPIAPIGILATTLTLVVLFELALFSFKALRWLFSHVPIVGGRG